MGRALGVTLVVVNLAFLAAAACTGVVLVRDGVVVVGINEDNDKIDASMWAACSTSTSTATSRNEPGWISWRCGPADWSECPSQGCPSPHANCRSEGTIPTPVPPLGAKPHGVRMQSAMT